MISKIFMAVSVVVLLYLLYLTWTQVSDNFTNKDKQQSVENFADEVESTVQEVAEGVAPEEELAPPQAQEVSFNPDDVVMPDSQMQEIKAVNEDGEVEYKYELEQEETEAKMNAQELQEQVAQIQEDRDDTDIVNLVGSNLLAAPLSERFYSINSIANVNRNASNDIRGDIAVPYNPDYTPFGASTIYGEPMTVNRLCNA